MEKRGFLYILAAIVVIIIILIISSFYLFNPKKENSNEKNTCGQEVLKETISDLKNIDIESAKENFYLTTNTSKKLDSMSPPEMENLAESLNNAIIIDKEKKECLYKTPKGIRFKIEKIEDKWKIIDEL